MNISINKGDGTIFQRQRYQIMNEIIKHLLGLGIPQTSIESSGVDWEDIFNQIDNCMNNYYCDKPCWQFPELLPSKWCIVDWNQR